MEPWFERKTGKWHNLPYNNTHLWLNRITGDIIDDRRISLSDVRRNTPNWTETLIEISINAFKKLGGHDDTNDVASKMYKWW